MTIDNSADNTEHLIEQAKAEALDRDIAPFLGQTAFEVVKEIPVLGQLLAAGEELRRKREFENVRATVDELKELVSEHGTKLSSVRHDHERLARFFRDGMRFASEADSDGIRHRVGRAMRSAILDGVTAGGYDEQTDFLKAAAQMSELDINVLVQAHRDSEATVFDRSMTTADLVGVSQDHAYGAIARLRALGFLQPVPEGLTFGGGAPERAPITALGKRFIEFALDDVVS